MGNTCSCCSDAIKLPEVEDVSHLDEAISFTETRLDAIKLPEVEDVSHLDEAISFAETRLDAILINKPKESTPGAETLTNSASVVSSIEYGSYFLENVARRVKRHNWQLVKSNSEIQKVVTDILKGAEQVQWVGAGLGVVAFILDQMDKMGSNRNECVEVLRFMCGVAKHIKRRIDHLVPEKLNDLVVFMVKGSIFCMSRMQSTDLSSSFSALVDEEEIKSLQSQLIVKYAELKQYPDEDDKKNAFDFPEDILSNLDELMSYIETCLGKHKGTDKAEENTSPVASSVKYGSDLLENVLKRCKRRGIKIISGDSRKVVIDVLKEASQVHWVAAGLSVVAYVLQKVDDASTNKEECFEFLQYMYGLAKHIKQLDGQITDEKKIHDVAEFIFKGSFFCVSRIQSSNLSRFFSSVVDVQEIKGLQLKLGRMYQDLTLKALIEALHRVPFVLPPSQGQYPDAVGIDNSVLEVTKLLAMDDENDVSTRAVVIYGVGGMGKTTLGNAVFYSLNLSAYKHCHLIIKQDCSETDVKDLQAQILKDMFGKNLQLSNSEQGHQEVSKVFREEARQPLFMFIDNALEGDDLAKILPQDLSCFPKCSRMLLTTRKLNETDILDQADKITREGFSINSLPDEEAKKLLSKKALDSPVGGFDASSDIDGLLRVCGGIPLVLNLVGTILRKHRNDLPAFNSTIETFKDSLANGESELTEKVVDVVYDSLSADRYKDAFLDIAAFFSSWKRKTVSYIVGDDELLALTDAALVKISDGRVELHDVVFKRGRKLSESNRIIDSQSLADIIEDTQRLEKVKGIHLPWSSSEFQLQAEHLDKMHKCLRVLIIGGGTKVSGACTRKFENLRYLGIHQKYCSVMEIRQGITPRLAVFEGYIRSDHRFCELPHSLRRLNVHDLESSGLDESFGKLSRLEELELRQAKQYMTRLPQSFGQFNSLCCLTLYSFQELISLPDNFGQLSNLKELRIWDCPSLSSLSDDFGQMKSLLNLKIKNCESLERLSDTFGQLSNLKDLRISDCPSLSSLSDDFGQMKSLLNLEIEYCKSLERLSDTFGQLSNLKELRISDCPSLSSLSDDFGQMKSLLNLKIEDCKSLERLSDTFGQLSNLKELRISDCASLSSLSDDFGSLTCVTTIMVDNCPILDGKAVDQMIELKSLIELDISKSPLLINRLEKIQDGHPCRIQMRENWNTTFHSNAGLSDEDSKKLLCLKALGSADKFFDKMVDIDGLLEICRGIPSVLEMVGSMLRKLGNDVSACESTIQLVRDTLAKGEGDLSEKIVDVVYDTLQEDAYKDAFLDITTFFCNWRERTVGYIVEEVALRAIQEAALVHISEEGRVIAHDIVQARGRKLSKEVRTTDPQSLERALQDTQRLEKLKGIQLEKLKESFLAPVFAGDYEEVLQLNAKHLDKMHKCLRVLILGIGAKVSGACSEKFENLRYLKINSGDRSPMELNKLPRLAIFEGRIRIDDRFCNLPDSLRRLKVDALESNGLDESFGKLSRLEELDISQNENYMTMLPQSFGQLKSLRCLKLSHFRELTSLPDTFGQLSTLEELNISDCTNFSSLSDNFGKLSNLKRLKIMNCENLLKLCDGFGELNNLKKLMIVNCTNLASLSDSFDQLSNLKMLVIVNCSNLSSLCSRFGQLKSLEYLRIRGCRRLQRLSDDFGSLACVAVIDSSGCPVLEGKAVDQMIQLKSLTVLNIRQSQLLIKRWEEIKEGSPLFVRKSMRKPFLRYSMSRALFDAESRFVDVDGVMVTWPSNLAAGKGKIVFLVTCCDLGSPSNEAACKVVKRKMAVLCRQGFHIIYVGLMAQSEESIGRTLRSLSQGIKRDVSLCAWIPSPSHYKWKELFGFFACMMLTSVWKFQLHTFIAQAHISASEQGNLQVQAIRRIFPKYNYEYEYEDEDEVQNENMDDDEDEDEEEVQNENMDDDEAEAEDEDEEEVQNENMDDDEAEDEDEEEVENMHDDEVKALIDLRGGFSSLYSHLFYSFISSTI